MLPFQELTKDLPPIRDDEPPSLRQEIADEIADHLQCSLRRELLLNGGDESSARVRVLDQFGDPAQIARQLWSQAMWSKIMSQRLMIVLTTFSILMTVGLAGLVGMLLVEQERNSTIMRAHMVEKVMLMQQLVEARVRSAEPPRDPNWNNLKIKVTLDSADGPPAQGYYVNVSQVPKIGDIKSNSQETHAARLGESGIDDCGFVGPGIYDVTITTPWSEEASCRFTVVPGKDHVEHCIAPSKMPEFAEVSLNLSGVPNDALNSHTAFVCSLIPTGSRNFAGHDWSAYNGWLSERGQLDTCPSFLFVPGHGIWITTSGHGFTRTDIGAAVRQAKWSSTQLPCKFQLPDHNYAIAFSIVPMKKQTTPDDEQWPDRVLSDSNNFANNKFAATFKVKAGENNECVVEVPDEIIECVKRNEIRRFDRVPAN